MKLHRQRIFWGMGKLEENNPSSKSRPQISIFYRNSTRNLTSWKTKSLKHFWKMRGNTNKLNSRISSSLHPKFSTNTAEVLKRMIKTRLSLKCRIYLELPWTISNTRISWFSSVYLQRLPAWKLIPKKDHYCTIYGRFCMEKKMSTSLSRISEWWSKSFWDLSILKEFWMLLLDTKPMKMARALQ